MKGICVILIALASLIALGKAEQPSSLGDLETAFGEIGSIVAKNLENKIHGVLFGHGNSNAPRALEGGIGLLPSPVFVKGNLNSAVAHGLTIENLTPQVKLDIIRLKLDIKFTIPFVRVEGDYNLNLSFDEVNPDNYVVVKAGGFGNIQFDNLQLDINAKLKGNIITGYRVDYLDYTIAPFSIATYLDSVLLGNTIPIAEYVEPFFNWYLHKELVSFEINAHEPLMEFIKGVVNKIVCPLCQSQ